ncbi:protein phosphatase 2C domain-containing protein [Streptomyces sp. NPDC005955]|uniref:PP2C family serine/threonine-protein phosphatase n=1 Tax=Streptomyces sp. NPDC005955 TaxID=3364738 RepID=UPI0036AFF66A
MSSQQPRSVAGPRCPRCAEPLEPGDRFCGVCGHDVSSVGAGGGPTGQDHPTIAMQSPGPPGAPAPGGAVAAVAPGARVQWPEAPEVSGGVPAPVHRAGDISGRTSGGGDLPSYGGRSASDGPEFRTDEPYAHPDPAPAGSSGDYPLPAPAPSPAPVAATSPPSPTSATSAADPREGVPAAGDPAGPVAKRCVFCGVGRVAQDDYCEHCGKAQPRERDHMETALDAVAAVSDRGLRHHRNEDAYAISSAALPDGSPAVVAIVCDGVSSASRPDEASLAASRAANECVLDLLPQGVHPQQAMHQAIVAASEAVNALAGEGAPTGDTAHQNAPACTLVGAIVADELLVIGWVGDSRAYWVPVDRSAPVARLTEDDSWAAQMVAAGLMNEAEAYADERAHAITGWLGADSYELEPHTVSFKPDRAGVVVVCTDGLWNYAESAQNMATVLPVDAHRHPLEAARTLVGHALDGGGHDNVTVALVPFPAPEPGAGSV